MKKLLLILLATTFSFQLGYSQCTPAPVNFGTPTNCSDPVNNGQDLLLFTNNCSEICADNTAAGWGTPNAVPLCGSGTVTNDLYFYASTHPANAIAGYDGSLVIGFKDYPGFPSNAPTLAVHAEVSGEAEVFGCAFTTTLSIDCENPAPTQANAFLVENLICQDQTTLGNNHLVLQPGSIPPLADILTILQAQGQPLCSLNDLALWIQVESFNGTAVGNFCFEVSTYQPGFICGDVASIPLSGTATSVSGSSSPVCLCDFAGNGGFHNDGNIAGATAPCPNNTGTSAWYHINVPFTNNADIDIQVSGTQNYNLSLISDLVCPDYAATNPIDGSISFVPNDTVQSYTPVMDACGTSLSASCVAPGDYWIVVTGETTKDNITVSVNANECIIATCPPLLTITQTADGTYNTAMVYEGDDIVASNTVSAGSGSIIYDGTNSVTLAENGATADSNPTGGFQATATGTGEFIAMVGDGCTGGVIGSFKDADEATVEAFDNAAAQLEEKLNNYTLNAAPNPSNGLTVISFESKEVGEAVVEIYDLSGQRVTVLHNNAVNANQEYQIKLNTTEMPKGLYLVRLVSDKGEVQGLKLSVQ